MSTDITRVDRDYEKKQDWMEQKEWDKLKQTWCNLLLRPSVEAIRKKRQTKSALINELLMTIAHEDFIDQELKLRMQIRTARNYKNMATEEYKEAQRASMRRSANLLRAYKPFPFKLVSTLLNRTEHLSIIRNIMNVNVHSLKKMWLSH